MGEVKEVMVQDNVRVCPLCSGALKKITVNQDISFICVDCRRHFTVIDFGQSCRELKCVVEE